MNPPPRLIRRLLLPVTIALQLALLGFAVLAALVGLLLMPLDRRGRLVRVAAAVASYVVIELWGLTRLAAAWLQRPLRSDQWLGDRSAAIVASLLERLIVVARRTVGFTVVVSDPSSDVLTRKDPVLVLARHGGLGDSFVLVWLLLVRYGLRPRVVLKDILLWDPLIDVGLGRLGACFLRAKADDRADRIAALAADIAPGDALLVFPEGANWTPGRRRHAISRLRARGQHQAARHAVLMSHVLPPRPGGVLACLDARPDLAVVTMAHSGLDKLTTVGQVWRALPFASPMVIRWWPAPMPPVDPDERIQWLTTEWAIVDEWIDAHPPDRASAPGS